jgi:hypothetical protein
MATWLCALVFVGLSMPTSAESADIWVLIDTRVNPNNARTEFVGGVGDPEFFGEPRFLGKYWLFTVADGSITFRDKDVDHGYLYFDATFVAKFDSPPDRLIPGDTLTLDATTKGSGYVSPYAGGWNSGIRFQYAGEGVPLTGDLAAATNLDFISDLAKAQFTVPAVTERGQLTINAFLWNCAACQVQYVYEPMTVEEGFVLTNTGTGEIKLNDVPLRQCAVPLQGLDRNLLKTSGNCNVPLKVFDRILIDKYAEVHINRECLHGLMRFINVMYGDSIRSLGGLLALTMLVLDEDPTICGYERDFAEKSSGNRISLRLQSGKGRFKPARADLSLDIETETARVRSIAANDFAVGYHPGTGLTVAACLEGSVTIRPSNPKLSLVTLQKGQQVEVTENKVGPVTQIPQTLPFLFLLTGEEE